MNSKTTMTSSAWLETRAMRKSRRHSANLPSSTTLTKPKPKTKLRPKKSSRKSTRPTKSSATRRNGESMISLGVNWNHPEQKPASAQGGFGEGYEDSSEFHFDGTGFSDFFEQFFGSHGRASGGFGRTQGPGMGGETVAHRGQDIEADILVTLDEIMHGSTRTIQLQRTDPRTGQSVMQTLRVKIPPGVRESQLIRLAGKGQEGMGGGESGNLYLRVKFAQHPDFRVRGTDLYYDLDLAPWEAVLGATIDIPTLDGTVSLKIPAGTMAERQLRLRGKGLPTSDGTRGNLYAVVSIHVPVHLTPEQKVLWEQLATKSTFNPRKPL